MNESFVTFSDIFLKDKEWAFPFIKKRSEKKDFGQESQHFKMIKEK